MSQVVIKDGLVQNSDKDFTRPEILINLLVINHILNRNITLSNITRGCSKYALSKNYFPVPNEFVKLKYSFTKTKD